MKHMLIQCGRLVHDESGALVWLHAYAAPRTSGMRAKCICGTLSPANITSVTGAKKWWREIHAAEIRGE